MDRWHDYSLDMYAHSHMYVCMFFRGYLSSIAHMFTTLAVSKIWLAVWLILKWNFMLYNDDCVCVCVCVRVYVLARTSVYTCESSVVYMPVLIPTCNCYVCLCMYVYIYIYIYIYGSWKLHSTLCSVWFSCECRSSVFFPSFHEAGKRCTCVCVRACVRVCVCVSECVWGGEGGVNVYVCLYLIALCLLASVLVSRSLTHSLSVSLSQSPSHTHISLCLSLSQSRILSPSLIH